MDKTYDTILICDTCCHHLNCEELPDENGRCELHLKEGDIELGEDLTINPMDTTEFNYDDLKNLSKNLG